MSNYKIGDILTGKVTGIQSYGVFVALDSQTQGLIHISECKHGYVEDLSDFLRIGDTITTKIIDIDEYTNKISLSIRALEPIENTSPMEPKRKKRKRYSPNIGFSSLENKLPKWIDEAKEKFVAQPKDTLKEL